MSDTSNFKQKFEEIQTSIDFEDFVSFEEENDRVSKIINNASSSGFAAQSGIQMGNLQSAMDEYARAMNQAAIAKSTGLPVRSPIQTYKGFAAEEYFKWTLDINVLAEGIPKSSIGIYTKGELPDGTVLSGIDMDTDISIWTRKFPWSKPMRTQDYQSKIHNDISAYAKDFKNPQYQRQGLDFVGGANQGVNDRIAVNVRGKRPTSDNITNEGAAELAEFMQTQSTPEYAKRQEKIDRLNQVTLGRAVAMGAATGFVLTTVQEIVNVVKKSDEMTEEQFIESIQHILCGTIEGGVRGGAITGSVQLFSKMIGREIAANSIEAIPAMVIANVAVDFAKDLYNCFVTQTIDTDDLLCNSVNNVFSSAAGFGGGYVGGQIGASVVGHVATQAVTQGASTLVSAQSAAATGAAIGSAIGPIGTVIGSVVGGIVIGIAANAIIGTANVDAQKAFNDCVAEINSHIELQGCEKLYYFADSMATISEFRLSFKNLLPCYNLISDLREYNLRKKAIKSIREQLQNNLDSIDVEKEKMLIKLEKAHNKKICELTEAFEAQKATMFGNFQESMNMYVANSYMQYLSAYEVMSCDAERLLEELRTEEIAHSEVITNMKNRNEVNEQLNLMLKELRESDDEHIVTPFISKIMWFMQPEGNKTFRLLFFTL